MSPHLRPPPLRLAMPVAPLSSRDGFAALLPSLTLLLRDGVLSSAGHAVQPGLLPADEKPQRSILSGSELAGLPGRCGEGPRPPREAAPSPGTYRAARTAFWGRRLIPLGGEHPVVSLLPAEVWGSQLAGAGVFFGWPKRSCSPPSPGLFATSLRVVWFSS